MRQTVCVLAVFVFLIVAAAVPGQGPISPASVGASGGDPIEIPGYAEPATAFTKPPEGHYLTEWVILLKAENQQMDRLARELSRKYRPLLALPDDGTYIPAADWAGNGTLIRLCTASGLRSLAFTTVSNGPCLDAARQEYAALKDQYEKALLQAFANWMGAVATGTGAGAVAAWEAVDDLQNMRFVLFGSRNPGEREPSCWDLLGKATARQICDTAKAGVGSLLKLGPTKGLPDYVQDYLVNKGVNAITNFEEQLGNVFSQVLTQPTPEGLDGIMAAVTALGDAALDLAAYPPATRGGRPAPDYYGLGGRAYQTTNLVLQRQFPPLKEETVGGYLNTGFAFQWNRQRILARLFGQQQTAYRVKTDPWKSEIRGQITLEARDMAELLAGRSVEKPLDDDITRRSRVMVARDNVYDWVKLEKIYEDFDTEYRQLGENGEKLWFARLRDPNPARVASAIRLLQMDLLRITQESDAETGANEAWKLALGEFKDLCAKSPALLNPVGAVIDVYLDKLIAYRSRDLRAEFAKDLNAAVLKSIRAISPPPAIPRLFPGGRAGIEAAIAPGTNTPPACQGIQGDRWKLVRVLGDANGESSTNDVLWDGAKIGEWIRTVAAGHWHYERNERTPNGPLDDIALDIAFDRPPDELVGGTSFELKVRATARSAARRQQRMAGGYFWCDELQIEPNYRYGPDSEHLDREYVGAAPAGWVDSKETTYRFTVPLKSKSVYTTTLNIYQAIIGESGSSCYTYEKVKP